MLRSKVPSWMTDFWASKKWREKVQSSVQPYSNIVYVRHSYLEIWLIHNNNVRHRKRWLPVVNAICVIKSFHISFLASLKLRGKKFGHKMSVGYPISNGKSSYASDHTAYERANVLNQLDWLNRYLVLPLIRNWSRKSIKPFSKTKRTHRVHSSSMDTRLGKEHKTGKA